LSFPERLAIASRNPGKIREIKEICGDWPVRWITADEDPGHWPAVEETGETYQENASLKARAVADAISVPALADDSGIEVAALGGAPGVRSARFAGPAATDEQNLQKLIEAIATVAESERRARYRCIAALAVPGGELQWAEATCEGRLITAPRGSGGFGYDPIFVPDEDTTRTMAELPSEQKNRISHRGRAFRALRALVLGG
jgi:XTP/dITP diphosphohydrolase